MSRTYGFHAPQERIEPKFWKANILNTHNTGKFMRNVVLDGAVYGVGDFLPAYIKTADLIHPFCGTYNLYTEASSVYGTTRASVADTSVPGIVNGNSYLDASSWAPGDNGMNSWFAVSLPEMSLADRYMVRTKAAEAPLSWKLQGSLDGTTWTDLHSVDNTGVWNANLETKEFTIPEETRGNYLWYKLLITGSNATTMKLYRFRLLRPANICPLGDFYIDASPTNPLTLSFMDGLIGGVPVDRVETITNPQVLGIFDGNRVPINPDISANSFFHIFAVRGPSGSVSFEVQGDGGDAIEYLSGGMQSSIDRGFKVLSGSHLPWGRTSYNSGAGGTNELCRADGSPFYLKRIWMTAYAWSGTGTLSISYDGSTYITINSQSVSTRSLTFDHVINKPVYKIKGTMTGDCFVARIWGGAGLYRYRSVNGVLYEKCTNPLTEWTPVQKIKLASGIIANGEVCNIIPKSTSLSQWQVNGDLAPSVLEQ